MTGYTHDMGINVTFDLLRVAPELPSFGIFVATSHQINTIMQHLTRPPVSKRSEPHSAAYLPTMMFDRSGRAKACHGRRASRFALAEMSYVCLAEIAHSRFTGDRPQIEVNDRVKIQIRNWKTLF